MKEQFTLPKSRPSRARGLKLNAAAISAPPEIVAPLAGAWIETFRSNLRELRQPVAPLAGAWIETSRLGGKSPGCVVAPLAGAWIETRLICAFSWRRLSRPSRARGLKQFCGNTSLSDIVSRPSRARGLKQTCLDFCVDDSLSRPSRARGLKHGNDDVKAGAKAVAPLAGAWIETRQKIEEVGIESRRAPRGRVD